MQESPIGMSHLGMCVTDLDRSLRFYRDLLGMRVVKDEMQDAGAGGLPHTYRNPRKSRRVVYLQYGVGGQAPILVLTSHPAEQAAGEAILQDEVGIHHLSFTVPDVAALTQKLLAAGMQTRGPHDAFRGKDGKLRTVYFRDPDDILIQFDEGLHIENQGAMYGMSPQ